VLSLSPVRDRSTGVTHRPRPHVPEPHAAKTARPEDIASWPATRRAPAEHFGLRPSSKGDAPATPGDLRKNEDLAVGRDRLRGGVLVGLAGDGHPAPLRQGAPQRRLELP